MKILDAKNISTVSIKVSEEIHKKHLHEFLRTNILNTQQIFSKNSYFYYRYIPTSSTYEVLVYEKNVSDTILEPFILHKDNTNKKGKTVYITPSYFTFFDKDELLLLKHITTPNHDDVSLYIQQIYKFDEFDLVEVSSEELEQLKNENYKIKVNEEIALYEDNSFKIFTYFIFISFVIFIVFLVLSKDEKVTPNIIKPTSNFQQNNIILNKPLDKVTEIFQYIHSTTIYITKLSFVNNKFHTILYDKEKSHLLKLIKQFQETIEVKSLSYDSKNKIYSMEVTIAY